MPVVFVHIHNFAYDIVKKCMVEVRKLYLDGLNFCIGLSEVKIIYIFWARFRQKQSNSNKKLGIARVL